MAEQSFFWQGNSFGDAIEVEAQDFSDFFSKIFQSNYAAGYILPGYGNNLKVQANNPVALNVILKSGAAEIKGRLYENTADETLTIDTADATNPRLDRVVLRVTFADQTIRAAVLTGTPAATPSLPALTQNATVFEISLAYVWVAATATTIGDESIHDEREFAHNFEDQFFTEPLLRCSEFLGPITTGRIYPPAGWTLVGTVTTFQTDTKPTQQPRGNAIKITAGAGDSGMQQIVPVLPSTRYVFRVPVKVTSGDVGKIVITTNAASPGTITREIRRTGSFIEENISYITEADATTMTVQLLAANNTDIVWYGQPLLTQGYIVGIYKPVQTGREILIDQVEFSTTHADFTVYIPSGLPYKNIRILAILRSDVVATVTFGPVEVNGDSGSNYDFITDSYNHVDNLVAGDGAGVASNIPRLLVIAGSTAPANMFNANEIVILDYAGANEKVMHELGARKIGTTTGDFFTEGRREFWRGTGAVTSLRFLTDTGTGGNLGISGSSISVYLFN